MRIEKRPILYKKDFIRELSFRTGYSISDTKKIWKEVEGIFEDCICAKIEIKIGGFGSLYYLETKERETVNPKTLEKVVARGYKRAAFRLAIRLRKMLHPEKSEMKWRKPKKIDGDRVDDY